MGSPQKLVVFYQTDEINTKDIDREIFTKDKNIFHLFFFHNFNLNIDKSDIFKKILFKEFDPIKPEMYIDLKTNALKMVKRIPSMDFKKIDKTTENEYKKYLDNINYRIKCILDTFKLFNNLYKDKTIIYIIPNQLSKKIIKELKNNKMNYKNIINEKDKIIIYYDIIYWANYFSRVSQESLQNNIINTHVRIDY